jgi:hypothetical protein
MHGGGHLRLVSSYGVAGPDGIEEGVYEVEGKYLYQYMYNGDLFLRAAPGKDYSALQSAGGMPRITDVAQREAVISLIKSRGKKLSGKDEISAARAKISGMSESKGDVSPVGFDAPLPPAPEGGEKFYTQPWFWVAAVGGTGLLGYIGYTFYKSRK